MKKLVYLFISLFVFSLTLGASPAKAAEYNWKLAHEELPGGFMDAIATEFAKRLAEKSNGRIELGIFHSGTLGTHEDMVELVQNNAIQFNFADIGHVGTMVTEAQALLLHYIFPRDSDASAYVLQQGTFRDVLDPLFRAKHIEPLAYYSEGWNVWTSNKPLHTPEDFKGFKIRTMASRLIVDNYKAYGANPTPVPWGEVYSGLQLNMIEGQENPTFLIHDFKIYEVQKYITFGYTAPFILTLITNTEFFAGLPEDIQKIIKETATELVPYGFTWAEEFNKRQLDAMVKARPDLVVEYLTDDEIAVFEKLAKPVRNVFLEMAPEHGLAVLEALENDIKAAKNK